MGAKKKYKIKKIPQHLKEYAHELTLLRLEANKDRYKSSFNKRTGKKKSVLLGEVEKDYYTEYVGILGELLTRRYYDIHPSYSGFKVSTFVKSEDNVSRDTDLIAYKNGSPLKISIKSGEGSFKANKASMDKDDADVVVFIVFVSSEQYLVKWMSVDDVKRFGTRGGYSEYYFRELPKTVKYDIDREKDEGLLSG